jgi:hypothetical protein
MAKPVSRAVFYAANRSPTIALGCEAEMFTQFAVRNETSCMLLFYAMVRSLAFQNVRMDRR